MRNAELKGKMRNRESITGSHIHLQDETVCEIVGQVGYDFLWIDSEHTPADYRDLLRSIRITQCVGTSALVRVTMHDVNHLKKVLEIGPDGIIFPMISTPAELEEALAPTLYPPNGTRGFGPIRAANYGFLSMDEYIRSADRNLIRLIQIETVAGAKNVEKLLQNPYLDGVVIGPCDLSGSLGELGNIMGERVADVVRQVATAAKKYGKTAGVALGSCDADTVAHFHSLGLNLFAVGADYSYVLNGAVENLKMLDLVLKQS